MKEDVGFWLIRRSALNEEKVALVYGERRITYGELNRRVNALANAFLEMGVRRGDRVAALLMNGNEILECTFACAKLGAIFVPINFRLSEDEVEYILRDSVPRVFVFHEPLRDMAGEVRRRVEVPEAVQVGGEETRDVYGYEQLVAQSRDAEPGFAVSGEDALMMMYTSGTTGRPKGAILTHANTQWNAINVILATSLQASDITLSVAPLFHIGAMGIFTLPLLYVGGTVVIQDRFGPELVLQTIAQEKVSVQFLLPAMWLAVMRIPRFDDYDLSSLRLNISGGAPCPLTVIEFFQARDIPFIEGFGLTETAPCVCVLDDENAARKNGSVGKPFFHVEVKVTGELDGEVPAGEVGELLVRGANVLAGYWNNPEATRVSLRGGWFHTGDLARTDDEGFLYIVDRKKDMLISGGENVYPVEVEQVLFRHPKVSEAAVIGTPDERWGESPMAFVVPEEREEPPSLEELEEYCRGKLARFKVPKRLEILESLPRNATGKVLKTQLRESESLVREVREG